MLAKDKFLKKINFIFFFISTLLFSNISVCDDLNTYLLEYNKSLKNTSFSFIQSDNLSIEEGNLYIGEDRIKIVYNKPTHITIIVSEKKGMYVNHDLKEVQFFDTRKTLINLLFKIIWDKSFFKKSEISSLNNNIRIKKTIIFNNIKNFIEVKYQDKPLLIRKIIIKNNQQNYEMGFFNHTKVDSLGKKFFSIISPYPSN